MHEPPIGAWPTRRFVNREERFVNKRTTIRFRTLIRFSLPYLLILAILCVLSGATSQSTYQLMLEESMEYHLLALNDSMRLLERTLAGLDAFSATLNHYEPLTKVLYASEGTPLVSNLLALREELMYYSDTNGILEDYLVYGKSSGVIVTGRRVFLRPEWYYGGMLAYDGLTYEEWLGTILTISGHSRFYPAGEAQIGSEKQRYILYVKPFINLGNGQIAGQTAFYLNETAVLSQLASSMRGEGMFVQLTSGETLLSHYGAECGGLSGLDHGGESGEYETIFLNGENYYLVSVAAAQFPLALRMGIPARLLQSQCSERLRGVRLCTALLMALVAAVAVFTILRNREPLIGLARHAPGKGDMRSIASAFTHLQKERDTLSQVVTTQNTQLREALFRQIMYGLNSSEAQVETQLEYVGVTLGGPTGRMHALYLVIDDEMEDDVDRVSLAEFDLRYAQLRDLLEREFSGVFSLLLLEDHNQIALIYDPPVEGDLSPLHTLYQRVRASLGFGVHLYLGSSFSQLRHACRSFSEARRLMRGDTQKNERYLAVESFRKDADCFDYGARDEERLLNLIDRAARDEIEAMLSIIFRHNFEERALSAHMCELLYSRMVSTLVQAEHRVPLTEPELLAPRGDGDPRAFFAALRRHIGLMCEQANIDRQQVRQQTDQEMLAFIQEHFANSELSITMLATRFGRSESYVSSRIKSLLGQPFSGYVEQLRVNRANELLAQGKMRITEISLAVGYNSPTAFGRAYKRVTGITPSEYLLRQNQEKEDPHHEL